jgi:hydroxymethylpyrimidine kinase/phosphomethylpyrimidine kinase
VTERALSIAGFDPSAGAGVLLDAFTFASLGYAPTACVASLTAQSSGAFRMASPVEPDELAQQIESVTDDGLPVCVKVGVVGSAANARLVSERLCDADSLGGAPAVLDPVAASSSGGELADDAVAIADTLAPCAELVTPNAAEAALFSGMDVRDVDSAGRAAEVLAERWGTAVVVTGVRFDAPDGALAADVLVYGAGREVFPHEFVEGAGEVRGTGCLFSSTCAVALARGYDAASSVASAQGFVTDAVGYATRLGRGRRQIDLAALIGAAGSEEAAGR